jgi:hypothetical protein
MGPVESGVLAGPTMQERRKGAARHPAIATNATIDDARSGMLGSPQMHVHHNLMSVGG